MNDEEFFTTFRIDRPTFFSLLDLIKDHPAISCHRGGPEQRRHFSPELHLLTTLKYFGSEGNGAAGIKIKEGLGIGKGTVLNYVNRTVTALLSLEADCLFWPSIEERTEIAGRIRAKHHFPYCVGIIDGTHLGLAVKPEEYGEEYWTRKQQYALAVLVFVDDQKRIRHLHIGWPGYVQGNFWRNSKVCLCREDCFSENEYLLGDSAFTSGRSMVPSYKRVPGQPTLPPGQVWFNELLSKPRTGVKIRLAYGKDAIHTSGTYG